MSFFFSFFSQNIFNLLDNVINPKAGLLVSVKCCSCWSSSDSSSSGGKLSRTN